MNLQPLVRYNLVKTKVPLWKAVAVFFTKGRFTRTRQDFVPVHPGEPGYDDAVYEATIIYDRAEMDRLKKIHGEN